MSACARRIRSQTAAFPEFCITEADRSANAHSIATWPQGPPQNANLSTWSDTREVDLELDHIGDTSRHPLDLAAKLAGVELPPVIARVNERWHGPPVSTWGPEKLPPRTGIRGHLPRAVVTRMGGRGGTLFFP